MATLDDEMTGVPTEDDLEELKATLVWAWSCRPTDDDIELYWYLRGYLRAECDSNGFNEQKTLDLLGRFLYDTVYINEDAEDREEE